MPSPSPRKVDGVTFDANCAITIALHLGTFEGREIKSYYVGPLRQFLRKCDEKQVQTAHFPFIKDECYRNLAKAVNDTAKLRGVRNYYARMKMLGRAQANLDRFFAKVPEVGCNPTSQEIGKARKFFQANEVDVTTKLNLQRPKRNIPEDNDLRLLVCTHNMPWNYGYIVSDDGHFVAYEDALDNSSYQVKVVPMKEITRRCIVWKWRL